MDRPVPSCPGVHKLENGIIYLIFFLFKHTDIGLEKLHYDERALLDANKSNQNAKCKHQECEDPNMWESFPLKLTLSDCDRFLKTRRSKHSIDLDFPFRHSHFPNLIEEYSKNTICNHTSM